MPADKAEVTKSGQRLAHTAWCNEGPSDRSIIAAQRSNIEELGATKNVFVDYGIESPRISGFVSTDPDGLLEFRIVLAK
jgi:hypothetical protein